MKSFVRAFQFAAWITLLPAIALPAETASAEEAKPVSKPAEIDGAATGAIDAAKAHFAAILIGDLKTLETTYTPTIQLMPGHEFLKEKYGLSEEGARARGAEVARDKLLETMAKIPRENAGQEYLDRMMPTFKFEQLEVTEGDFVTDPTDPVDTPDGKLHFSIKEGDILVKIFRPAVKRGDFLLLQLRELEEKWQVVSEYFD